MIFDLTITALTERGVQCFAHGDDQPLWLPREPGKWGQWREVPEIGKTASAKIESWMVQKHRQLRGVASQRSLNFHQPVGLGPIKSQGAFPMAYDNNNTGALFKNTKRENDKQPLYRGQGEVNGRKVWISAWIKKSERTGETFMSLAFTPADEQRHADPQPTAPAGNTYARATGRDEPIPF